MFKLSLIGLVTFTFACAGDLGPEPEPELPELTGSGGVEVRNVGDPVIEVIETTIRDERGDVIDLSSGAPIHDHQGDAVVLGADGDVPTVHKYAYLLDETAPEFGAELAPNPLTFRFRVTDRVAIDAARSTYRVRAADGRVLLQDTPVPAEQAGHEFAITLHRRGAVAISALGKLQGELALEVRFVDVDGSSSEATVRWNHVPLAAPLVFEQAGVPGVPGGLPGHERALHSLELGVLDGVAFRLLSGSPTTEGASIGDQIVLNPTNETVFLAVDIAGPTVHAKRAFTIDNARAPDRVGSRICDPIHAYGSPCVPPQPELMVEPYESPLIDAPAAPAHWGARAVGIDGLFDGSEAKVYLDGERALLKLMPRTRYRVSTELAHDAPMIELRPSDADHPDATPYIDLWIAGVWITGTKAENAGGCVELSADGEFCFRDTHVYPYRALTFAELSLEGDVVSRYGTTVSRTIEPVPQHEMTITAAAVGTWSREAPALPPSEVQ